ncbi:adenylate cyclase [Tepidamorphus gemmatus]|uniref:Adenylate cyclase n=1 Tax=Tepidamorphus gemmatus TaxID=747076 RepID=A0A4R3M8D5_9HYPH|nr:adenylate/guanylate cyclase domain-containing protein [Tepidamorphus gemmatus]TCT09362.1 adenylate cyclase [Tepidamorphus gemmatus]
MTTGTRVRDLRDWILEEGHSSPDLGSFIGRLGERLVADGVPVYRLTTGIPILHPLIRAETALWIEGQGVSWRQFPQSLVNDRIFTNSPLYHVYTSGRTVRVAVSPTPEPGEFGILADLRADGATDYVAFPLRYSDGSFKSLTMATRRAGGFSADDIALFESILHPVAIVFEVHSQRRSALTLLGTYLGRSTAPRVLAGDIRRGDGEQIEAVIWFSDLRGFTDLSGEFTPRELVDVLDFYFETMTDAVEERGGEVLKFIGDAVLAIFPYANEQEARQAAANALDAAQAAVLNLQDIHDRDCAACASRLSVGISLHVGAVFYGNVGGRERLDFTVVGEAVNIGSRINGLTRDLDVPVLASEDFVEYAPAVFEEMGIYTLRGVRRPQRVFRPAATVPLMAGPMLQNVSSRP